MNNETRTTVSRPLVGVIAIALLIAATVLWLWPGDSTGAVMTWRAACLRIGIVMAALWLALPTGSRPAAWANLSVRSVVVLVLAAAAVLRIPVRVFMPLAVVTMALSFVLRPRSPKRPERRPDFRPR